ncbi:MAG: mandelate racemase/muconate lactonizing enzyme family protein [Moorea sp. SIO2I5]|nr:mandelate racemase/muconate lactonizing enzyme family protein [Moorena sp. SIO2I5]
MKISQISVYQVTLPLKHPYSHSGGRFYADKLDSTIVAIDTDEGVRGWGEGCPWGSAYSPAFAQGIRAGIKELAPQLIGLDPRRTDSIYRTMDRLLVGHLYIKSALDMACWDILGKVTGLPLCELFGGRIDQAIPIETSVPTGTPDEMIESIVRGQEQGNRIHGCKIGSDIVQDLERIKAIVTHLLANESVTFDANGAWLIADALQVMNTVTAPILYFEQPCKTYKECLQVRQLTRHPIILDECIQHYNDVVCAHTDKACEAIKLKVGRVGGLSKAKRIRDFCVETGIPMNIAATGGSVIEDTGVVHLAQSTPATHLRAVCLIDDMVTINTAMGGARNQGGKTYAPEGVGLGVEPILDVLGKAIAIYQ